ncbi:MAG: hypothetical protein AB7V01_20780, partial [Vicinamibacterales bacterium]
NPYGRGGGGSGGRRGGASGGWRGGKAREPVAPVFAAYEDEDQSAAGGLRTGAKVRHAQFGLGTVLSVEVLDDDFKLVVRFQTVGQKTLRAKYAKLEMVG